MSYCVNCGVELDKTCSACPLCNTVVYNPNQPIDHTSAPPFPVNKGTAEPVKRYEFTILMSIICGTVSIVCGILNYTTFTRYHWSIFVIGFFVLLWIALLPKFFPNTISLLTGLILIGVSVTVYFGVLSYFSPGNGWYRDIAFPIILLSSILVIHYYVACLRKKSSFIKRMTLLFGSIGILALAIEALIDLHFRGNVSLVWSIIVASCCGSIDIILITISFLSGIRGELRKRMHF